MLETVRPQGFLEDKVIDQHEEQPVFALPILARMQKEAARAVPRVPKNETRPATKREPYALD